MRGIVGVIFPSALTFAACYAGPGPEHFVAIVDELDVPAGWDVAETVVRGPDEDDSCDTAFSSSCPGAIRSFVVEGDAAAAYAQATDVVTAAGFTVTEELIPEELLPDCRGALSRSACSFRASREGDQIFVSVHHSAADVGLPDGVPGVAAVVMTASRDLTG